jgi:uncharacterized membrane protein
VRERAGPPCWAPCFVGTLDTMRASWIATVLRRVNARTKVAAGLLCGIVAGGAVWAVGLRGLSVLLGWDVAAVVYTMGVWVAVWPLDFEATERLAERQDPTRAAADLLLLTAAVASLAAVGVVLVNASRLHGSAQDIRVALGLVSVVASWVVVHTVYTQRYAWLYYYGDVDAGVSFNQDEPPRYSDFAYLSFTLGMTFQVSDTDLQNQAFRRTALGQALLSYLFGAGILATTVNLVASLSTQ